MRYMPLLAMYVAASVSQAQELPSAPGRLIDIGGRRLHLMCSGTGAPTIVLEAGASSFAIDWTLVQRQVERTTRVCSYDRAAMGWSDPSPDGPRANTVDDLRKLLSAAGVRAPYVLVGASRGGLFVRDYQAEHPDEVVGLVFVDPSTEDRLFTRIDGQDYLIAEVTAEQLRATLPTRPVAVPRRRPQTGAPFDRLPPEVYQVRQLLDLRLINSIPDTVSPDIIAAATENERALLARLRTRRAREERPLRDMPVVVLTRGNERNAGRETSHRAVAALSSNSRHTVVDGAGHEIHLFAPAVVVQAVEDVIAAVRSRSSLPPR